MAMTTRAFNVRVIQLHAGGTGMHLCFETALTIWLAAPVPDGLLVALEAQRFLMPWRVPIQAFSAFRLGFSNAVHRLPRVLGIKPEHEEFYDFGFEQGMPIGLLFEAFGYDQRLQRREG